MQNPIEQEIQAKGLTAPRITPDAAEANVIDELYFTALDGYAGTQPGTADDYRYGRINSHVFGLLTFCVLVLKNGFTVTGESACASPENFDAEIGRKIARQNAFQKIWPLMGYELRSKLALKGCCGHDSDCAVHNEPAYPVGPCDCSQAKGAESEGGEL